jgi:hypothetical protein
MGLRRALATTDEGRMRLMTGVPHLCDLVRARARTQDGSFLVEAMVSAMIIVMVGLGVMKTLDRGTRLGGEQKVQAVAGNVAQSEIERIRGMPVSQQSNLRDERTATVGGVTYSISSRANWVNDTSGDATCTTTGARADYMKLETVVTWPGMSGRKPVTLESLISPGVRAFNSDQGSLAVKISDRNGDGVAGVLRGLSGGASDSDTTNDSGCVMWGYLPSAASYTLSFSRPPDYVRPDGSQSVSAPVAVVGGQTSNYELQFDRGGRINAQFVTKRTTNGTLFASNPQKAHVTNAASGAVSSDFDVTSGGGTSDLLFPFANNAYTIHADSCALTEVPTTVPTPVPAPPFGPAAPSAVSALVEPGTTTSKTVQLPALNLKVRSNGVFKAGLKLRVTTPCGTVYDRETISTGEIDDPGFPYASTTAPLTICASDGSNHETTTRGNTNYNVTALTITLTSTDPVGDCP